MEAQTPQDLRDGAALADHLVSEGRSRVGRAGGARVEAEVLLTNLIPLAGLEARVTSEIQDVARDALDLAQDYSNRQVSSCCAKCGQGLKGTKRRQEYVQIWMRRNARYSAAVSLPAARTGATKRNTSLRAGKWPAKVTRPGLPDLEDMVI